MGELTKLGSTAYNIKKDIIDVYIKENINITILAELVSIKEEKDNYSILTIRNLVNGDEFDAFYVGLVRRKQLSSGTLLLAIQSNKNFFNILEERIKNNNIVYKDLPVSNFSSYSYIVISPIINSLNALESNSFSKDIVEAIDGIYKILDALTPKPPVPLVVPNLGNLKPDISLKVEEIKLSINNIKNKLDGYK